MKRLLALLCALTALFSLARAEGEDAQRLADSLLPGLTVRSAKESPKGTLMLLEKPNQVGLVFAVCRSDGEGWSVVESTTLTVPPASVEVAEAEADCFALRLNSCTYTLGEHPDGSWGLVRLQNEAGETVTLGQNHVGYGPWGLEQVRWGTHPWSDITCLDWQSLPQTGFEAIERVDPTGWAVVANPDALDTLHLRQRPAAGAYSLGRYYNGAPLRVLSSSQDWLQVAIGDTTGWMKKDFVAQAHAMQGVESAVVERSARAGAAIFQDSKGKTRLDSLEAGETLLLVGTAGDDFYHVLRLKDWTWGYVKAEDCEE